MSHAAPTPAHLPSMLDEANYYFQRQTSAQQSREAPSSIEYDLIHMLDEDDEDFS